jgi:succinate dehydrogenase / fumarate reductase, cytochrome b subunit
MAAITNFVRTVNYRGREGYIAWLLHRIAGVGVFLFLGLHILDIVLMLFGPAAFEKLLFFYHQFLFKLMIVFGLYLGVLYHALNGLRVTIIDFWPALNKYAVPMWRGQMVIFALAYIPSAIFMLATMF